MAGKIRVSALAKELQVTPKRVIDYLGQIGEFVKSASSTIEEPVADRARRHFHGADEQEPSLAVGSMNESPRKTDYVLRHLREISSAVGGALDGNDWPPRSYSRKDWVNFCGSVSALSFHLADATRRLRLVEAPAEGVTSERSFPMQEELHDELLRLAHVARID